MPVRHGAKGGKRSSLKITPRCGTTFHMDTTSLHNLRAAAAAVFAHQPILVAYAFGSRVSGTPRPDSDLDVAYFSNFSGLTETSPGLPLEEELGLAAALSERIGLTADLRCLDQAPLETRGRVLEEGIRIYSGDDVRRVALERSTLSYYHDYKAIFIRMRQDRLRAKARRGVT
jgi:predicted nucleotidyltransferase